MTSQALPTEQPTMGKVVKIIDEATHHKSIFVESDIQAKPGQFIMVWVPGVDEKPMAVAYQEKGVIAFTYHTVGKFTKACDKLKKGDLIGIRGPYGKGFSTKKNACVVGGGVGLSSVSTLIEALDNPIVIHGARSKELLLYQKRFNGMLISTDDGSQGHKGYVTDILDKELAKGKISVVYTCGPEVMMNAIVELCEQHKVECEVSIERYMKCCFGICGNCVLNDKLVCMDGPIFSGKEAIKLPDFGNFARGKTGRKVTLKEYYRPAESSKK